MTESEIKSAIEKVKKISLQFKPDGIDSNCQCDGCNFVRPNFEALQLLISLAEQVLAVDAPLEHHVFKADHECTGRCYGCFLEGKNEALQDCRLYMAKMKIVNEPNGCDNNGNPVIYGLGGGYATEKVRKPLTKERLVEIIDNKLCNRWMVSLLNDIKETIIEAILKEMGGRMKKLTRRQWVSEAARIYVKDFKWLQKDALLGARELAGLAKNKGKFGEGYYDAGDYSPEEAVQEDMSYWDK